MNIKPFLVVLALFVSLECFPQVSFKTEYLGSSQYWHEIDDETREKVGDSKGAAIIYQGDIKLPLSIEMNTDSMPTICGLDVYGSYAKLDNKKFTDDMVSEIMNLQLGVFYLKPLNRKWSVLSVIGGGIYAPFSNLSKIKYKNILGSVGVIFIRHLKPNLDIGGGLAVNSTFGYPMVFPTMYFNWTLERNFVFSVSMMSGLEVKAGYNFSKHYQLNLIAEVNGQLALLEKDNKDVMFSNQYIVTGISQEIIMGKHFSLSLTGGINAVRPAYYNERSLKGMFNDDAGYYFGTSPYASVGFIIK